MTTIEDQRIRKSIQNLNEWQSQIIHGGNHFGEIANVIQLLLDTIAERDEKISELESAERDRFSQWQFGVGVLDRLVQRAHQALPNELPMATLDRWIRERFEFEVERDTDRAALAKFGFHLEGCRARAFGDCTCGFTAALEATK